MRSEARKQAEERVGILLDGKWRLDSFLGYGGSAAVYAATHRNGKRAAVKILHRHCAADPDLVARFVREGYLANKIQHPGVVSVLDDDTSDDGLVYLVMELLEGRSFERHGRGMATALSIAEGLQVADDLLGILVAAHAIGLVHRDIKPANLFLTDKGELKILDFGIARLAETFSEGVTQTGMLMGTPAFMPPEQARGRWDEVDARSDLWSVGVTLSSLMSGKRPRTADTPAEELLAAMMQPMPSLASTLPSAPPQVIALIDKAHAFEREQRWQSATEMQAAVREVRRLLGGSFAPSTTLRFAPETSPPVPLSGDGTPQPIAPYAPLGDGFSGGTLLTPAIYTRPSVEPEAIPSLTTNRATMRNTTSTTPPPKKAPRVAAFAAIMGALALAGLITIGVTVARRPHAASAPSAPSAASAPSTSVPPPLATQAPATDAAVTADADAGGDPARTTATATPATSSSTAAADRKPGKRTPKARPEGSADPTKFFDQRF